MVKHCNKTTEDKIGDKRAIEFRGYADYRAKDYNHVYFCNTCKKTFTIQFKPRLINERIDHLRREQSRISSELKQAIETFSIPEAKHVNSSKEK